MEHQQFKSFNGTYVELTPRADESLREAGFENAQDRANFSRAMAAAVARAERLHVTQVAAERAMSAAVEQRDDEATVTTSPGFSRSR